MPEDIMSVDSIEIVGGVSSINLSIDRGAAGQRGSYVIPWVGNPNDVTFPVTSGLAGGLIYPQTLDWYLNLNPEDEDYLCMYQLKQNNEWEFIFKLIPNVVHDTRNVTFSGGIGLTTVSVSDVALVLRQIYGTRDVPVESESVDSEAEMLALDVSVDDYAYRTDTSSFYRATSVPADSIASWQKELTVNLDIDFQNIYPVAKNFIINKPFAVVDEDGTKTYSFPITIIGSEVNPSTGWSALSGSKEVHLSLSVI